MPTGQDAAKAKLNNLIKGYGEGAAIDWLRCKFPSFETGSARKISIGESKGEKDYLASARLLGHITRLPEKSGDTASNRPLVVVAVEMKGDMTERTSRAGQFAFAKRVLRDAVNSGATGLDGLPSQGLFFFHDANGTFRISLVTGEVEGRRFKFNEAKRQSFFVRPDAANNIIRRRFHDPIKTLSDLKEAFSVEQLTKEFYRELFNWYEWAKDSSASFPNILNEPKDPKKEKQYNHEAIIRLITRLMFTWFIRQRNLVPDVLFDREGVGGILKKFTPDSMVEDNYYRAILQNLFFATFNTPQSGKDKLTRRWIVVKTDARGNGVGLTSDYHVTTVYRYKDEFKDSDGFLVMMRKVPFLNCALFDCLDKIESKEDGGRRMYFDGFSTKQERRAHVPNGLFFGDGEEGHMGIITLFDQYEFTIDENEVNDGDVALDPELLGKVFENLLGAYNPETQATARNATGSFYTPREIVDYMVEESLKNYLRGKLSLGENDSRLDELFDKGKAAEKAPTGFSREEEKAILEALYACRIIDPACGSGAFPMGILNCMVRLLKRLDDDTGTSIREYLLKRYREDKDRRDPTETEEDRQERLAELEKRFCEGKMYPDYARKLYLIENCIYGVDIQPIAAQISKLRFFISLLCDQFRTSYNPNEENYGLLSLPNLEAKFVCANTLIALPDAGGELDLTTGMVGELRDKLVLNRHKIFGARSTKTKEKYKAQDKEIRRQIREAVRDGLSKPDLGEIARCEAKIKDAQERRKTVEKPDWEEVSQPAQMNLIGFGESVTQPMLVKRDRNAAKRDAIDDEIDWERRRIAKEQAKGCKENIIAATKYADLVAGWDPFDQNASSPFFDPAWMFNIKDGFDIVIGNPPYGFRSVLSKEEKEYFRNEVEIEFRSGDSAELFVKIAFDRLLRNKGIQTFIIPKKSLYGEAWEDTRLNYWRNRLLYVLDTGKSFENVLLEAIVFGLEKEERGHEIKLGFLQSNGRVKTFVASNYNAILSKFNTLQIYSVLSKSLYEKIQKKSLTEYASGKLGLTIGTDFYSDKQTKYKLLKGIDVGRFVVRSNRYLANQDKLNWDKARDFLTPKVVCQRLVSHILNPVPHLRFAATYDDEGLLITNTLTSFRLPAGIQEKFFIGYLNSQFCAWYAYNFIYGQAVRGMDLYDFYIKQIPIPMMTKTEQNNISKIVDFILVAKKSNPNADTAALESEIDALVYKLYGLTKEEIAIVEGRDGKDGGAVIQDSSDTHQRGAAKVHALPDVGRAGSRPSRKPPRNDDDDEVLE